MTPTLTPVKNKNKAPATTPPGAATPVPPVPTPTPANTASLTDIQSTPRITEAPPVQMQDFNQFIAGYKANTDKEDAAIAANREAIRAKNAELANKGERGEELDAEYGLPGMYDESAKLRRQIADLTGSFDQAIVNEEGVARPMEFITGRQDFLGKQKASQIGALSAAQAAMDGNIALAESRIDRTIEREFGDIQAELDAATFELTENKDDLAKKDQEAYQNRVDALAERGRQLQEQKETRKEILTYAAEAAKNGAPAEMISRISQAKTAEEALGMAGGYIGLVDRQQAYASMAASRTGQLIELAKLGDPKAIAQLGFDPASITPELDETTRRQLDSKNGAEEELINLAGQYKTLIDKNGYTNTLLGNSDVIGDVRSLRTQITTAYKAAKELGSLDNGVLKLMEGVLGEEPTSGFNFVKNATGRRSSTLSSQLETFIDNTALENAKTKMRLGLDPSIPTSGVLDSEEDELINQQFGTQTSSAATAFNPDDYLN